MDETIEYIAERYPEFSRDTLGELRTMGLRFCSPVINYTPDSTDTVEGDDPAGSEAAAA